jgi:hypothetical protein
MTLKLALATTSQQMIQVILQDEVISPTRILKKLFLKTT